MIAVLFILTRPNADPKPLKEYENSTYSDKVNSVQPIAGHSEDDISQSSSSLPNSKLYYASQPRSYHNWAKSESERSLPTVNFAVTYPNNNNTVNPNDFSVSPLWKVDENYVDNK